jgi:hypothetical protein
VAGTVVVVPVVALQYSATLWPAAWAARSRLAAATDRPGWVVRAPNARQSPARAGPVASGPTAEAACAADGAVVVPEPAGTVVVVAWPS